MKDREKAGRVLTCSRFAAVLASFFFAGLEQLSNASATDEAFAPTWKLLKQEEKKQFLAGYMYGWQDAARVTDATIEFAKENPSQVVNGLKTIRDLYSFEGVQNDGLVIRVDDFFSKAENKGATLSQAITAVKKKKPVSNIE